MVNGSVAMVAFMISRGAREYYTWMLADIHVHVSFNVDSITPPPLSLPHSLTMQCIVYVLENMCI